MNKDIYENELIYLSKYVGMRSDYVQAGGGNISIKISDKNMIIKSSGVQLADIHKGYGITCVDYIKIRNFLYTNNKSNIENIDKISIIKHSLIKGNKPSIETFLHSITYKYTIHIHSTIINILTCRKNGMKILQSLFPEAVFVEYALPGLELALKLMEKCEKREKKEIIFLKNHGAIVSDNLLENVILKLEQVINIIANYLKIDIQKYSNVSYLYQLYKNEDEDFQNIIYLSENENIRKALKKNKGHLWKYLFFPDSVVYCGCNYIDLTKMNKIQIKDTLKKNKNAILIVYNNNIYINTISLKRAKEIESVLSATAEIYLNTYKKKMDYLDENQQNKINKSKLEQYRKSFI